MKESKYVSESKAMKISDSKGKWGSCNSLGSVCFNWRVIMLPPRIIDYVIVHELCHLVHMNHSEAFWKLVEEFCPKYKACKQWLKDNIKILYQI